MYRGSSRMRGSTGIRHNTLNLNEDDDQHYDVGGSRSNNLRHHNIQNITVINANNNEDNRNHNQLG